MLLYSTQLPLEDETISGNEGSLVRCCEDKRADAEP
jgi:hypothetical protein